MTATSIATDIAWVLLACMAVVDAALLVVYLQRECLE
jgi:hypothetical protein